MTAKTTFGNHNATAGGKVSVTTSISLKRKKRM
jgi:hypothetical protein